MNFEPYAIGFPKELLEERGAVFVKYNGDPAWDSLCSGERWESEREWRVRGDLVIDSELYNQSILITRKKSEIDLYNHPHSCWFEKEK